MKKKDKQVKWSTKVENTLNMINEINSQYLDASHKVNELDLLQSDLLHKLENDNLTYHEQAKIALQLTEARRNRRVVKNKVEILLELRNVTTATQFQQQMKYLRTALNQVKQLEQSHENWFYKNRVLGTKESESNG